MNKKLKKKLLDHNHYQLPIITSCFRFNSPFLLYENIHNKLVIQIIIIISFLLE